MYSTRKTCNPSPFKVSRYSGKDTSSRVRAKVSKAIPGNFYCVLK